MDVDPGPTPRAQIESENFVAEIAEAGQISDQRRRRGRVADARHSQDFPAVADADAAKDLVAACNVRNAVSHGRRAVDVVFGLELPYSLAVARVEAVERAVVGADQHAVADYHRRRFDLPVGLVSPEAFAS